MKADFNNARYTVTKETDAVLSVRYDAGGTSNTLIYDFNARILLARASYGGLSVTPFSQLDRESLIEMRDKLIELKGNPPELPPEENFIKAQPKKFSL